MITAAEFVTALDEIGCHQLAGVPCSYLADVYDELAADDRFDYVPAANEGAAYTIAAGLLLAGRESAVLLQNSGLGNLVNPLTSFAMPYRIPVLAFTTMRGWPVAGDEEPQHEVMGRCTAPILEVLGLPHHVLPGELDAFRDLLGRVQRDRRRGVPAFILIPSRIPGTGTAPTAAGGEGSFGRREALAELTRLLPDALFVTTTGYISRELFALRDRPENLYLQGAMGHAASVAAGVALGRPGRRVVAVDGDGSALMHLGALSTIGHLDGLDLVHVILDNGGYESTGSQGTTAGTTAFPQVATACGYRASVSVGSAAELRAAGELLRGPGPALAHVRIAPRSAVAGSRATSAIQPDGLARRFAAAAQGREDRDADVAARLGGDLVRLGPARGG